MAVQLTPPVPVMPPAPQRNSPTEQFNDQADAFVAALGPQGQAIHAVAAVVEHNARETLGAAEQGAAHLAQVALLRNQSEQFAQTAVNAPGTSATSSTNLTIGTGAQVLVVQTGKALRAGQTVSIAVTSDGTKRMVGPIRSYDPATGALEVVADAAFGSGAYAAWTVALSAPGTIPVATREDVWAGTDNGKAVTAATLAAADAFQVLQDAPIIAWNTATQGYKAEVTLNGAPRELGLPSNLRLGRTYTLKVKQPPSGGPRLLGTPGPFKFGAAGTPVLSTAANAVDVIRFEVLDLTGPILDARFNKVS